MRSAEDRIILAIVLEGEPLGLSELADRTGLRKQNIAYWLPRMVASGTLLRLEDGGVARYQPQPILLADWMQDVMGELFAEAVERHDEFFVFEQAECGNVDVIRNNITASLRMFCVQVRDLSK